MPFYGACAKHDDREAKRRCFRCKDPICPECQRKEHGHIFCDSGCASEHEKELYLKKLEDNRKLDEAYGVDPTERLKLDRPKKKGKEKPKKEKSLVIDLSDSGVKVEPARVLTGAPATPPRPIARAAYPRPQNDPTTASPAQSPRRSRAPLWASLLLTIVLLETAGLLVLVQAQFDMKQRIAYLTDTLDAAAEATPPPQTVAQPKPSRNEWSFRWPDQTDYEVGNHILPVSIAINGKNPPASAARLIVDDWAGEWRDVQNGMAQFRFEAQEGPHRLQIEILSDDLPAQRSPSFEVVASAPSQPVAAKKIETPKAIEPEKPLPMIDIERGIPTRPRLSLTFDGGSEANISGEVLDILKEKGIKTTMFLTGRFIEKHPETLRRIVAEGHEVGNHSYSHPHLTTWAQTHSHKTLPNVNRYLLRRELEKTAELFEKTIGQPMAPLWRAPYGEINEEILGWAREMGWRHVAWTTNPEKKLSLDSHDWIVDRSDKLYKSAEEIKEHLLGFARADRNGLGGGIILMHLGTQRRIDQAHTMLESLIDEVRGQGYSFTKVSSLMREM